MEGGSSGGTVVTITAPHIGILLVCMAVIEKGEFVGGAREFGLAWRDEVEYERWAMGLYKQMATEAPMPERLFQKQLDRAMESEGEEDGVSAGGGVGGGGVGSLTSSSSFSSLLSLISTPSRPTSAGGGGGGGGGGGSGSALSLSAEEKVQWERKLHLIQSSPTTPTYILPPSPILVQKHKRGLFSSTWKKRWAFLTEDIVGLSEMQKGKATQLLVLSLGRAAVKASQPTPATKKAYHFTLDVDVWMKGSAVTWAKRSVLFALNSADDVRVWVDAISSVLSRRRRVSMSLPWQTPTSSRAHHSSLSLAGGGAGGHQRTPSTWTSALPVNRPLLFAQSSGTSSGSSSPVVGAVSSSPSSNYVPPLTGSYSSYSSSSASPPSASRTSTFSAMSSYAGASSPSLLSPPVLSGAAIERRRNSITRLLHPPSGVETVEEGREEPASAKSVDAAHAHKAGAGSGGGGGGGGGAAGAGGAGGTRSPLASSLSLDIDDHEPHIEPATTLILPSSKSPTPGRVHGDDEEDEEEEREEAEGKDRMGKGGAGVGMGWGMAGITEDGEDGVVDGDGHATPNGYHHSPAGAGVDDAVNTLVARHLQEVEAAFDEAELQLADEDTHAPTSLSEDERKAREGLLARVHGLLAQLHDSVTSSAKGLEEALEQKEEQEVDGVGGGGGADTVLHTFRATMPAVDLASLSSSLFPPPVSSLNTLGNIFGWDYDIFALPPSSLLPLVYSFFSHFAFFSLFAIPLPVFSRFICSIQLQYHANPFHSFYHAVDVAQTCFVLLTSFHASRCLTAVEQFSLLIAALCHDVSHPALNNSYQVSAQTQLALIYNDQSVLENHHAAVTFHTLAHHACNIFASFHPLDSRHARRCITGGILSTDMAVHFQLVDRMQAHVDAGMREGRMMLLDAQGLTEGQRQLLFSTLLHAGDISNPCKAWQLHERWTRALLQEMDEQGQREEREGLPRSPHTDKSSNIVSQPHAHILVHRHVMELRKPDGKLSS